MYCKKCGKEIPEAAKFCTNCGTALASPENEHIPQNPSISENNQNKTAPTNNNQLKTAKYQTARFVISILTLVLSLLILLQSCAVGVANAIDESSDLGGTVGLVLCICWWVAAILNLSKNKEIGAVKTSMWFYIVGGCLALFMGGSIFEDLMIYGIASLGFAVLCYISTKS